MIARLSGFLIAKEGQDVVIDCHGVGYVCAMTQGALAKLGPLGSTCTVWIHTLFQQEQLRLYGFLQREEQDWFVLLCSAPGVGPKLALAILSHSSPAMLRQAISQRHIQQLIQVPGLGRKKAEQLCLALQDKLPAITSPPNQGIIAGDTLAFDLQAALLALGFAPHLATSISEKTLQEQPDQTDIGALLRSALKKTQSSLPKGAYDGS